ncbi:MAG: DUF6273 domain-containing protein, partial [Coriobacteriia bacterium]|nr:DUF6273 domain-containing protein [Coriobacteriia bacterium]
TVTVKKQAKVTAYQYRISLKSTMAKATVKASTKTSTSFARLKQYTTYYVQARAYKTVKGKKYYGAWSTKKKVRTLCAHPASKRAVTTTKAATCTDAGATKTTCSQCKKVLKTGTLKPLGHKVLAQVNAADPTCTDEGVKSHWECPRCNAPFAEQEGQTPLTKEAVTIPPKGHGPFSWIQFDEADFWLCSTCNNWVEDMYEQRIAPAMGVAKKLGIPVQNDWIDYSWTELGAIGDAMSGLDQPNADLLAYHFNIIDRDRHVSGKTKILTLTDGTELPMDLLGTSHDIRTDGKGKAGLTFGANKALPEQRAMNDPQEREGGWATSDMRAWLNGDFYNDLLPAEVKPLIKSVEKISDSKPGSQDREDLSRMTASSNKVWLLGAMETYSGRQLILDPYSALEGDQYMLYKQQGVYIGARKALLKTLVGGSDVTTESVIWWLRGASGLDGFTAVGCYTNNQGWYVGFGSNEKCGVVPCFCF